MDTAEDRLSYKILIPLPCDITRGFGVEATSGPDGVFIQCRGLRQEREKIMRAAHHIGMPYGAFIRRTLNDVAEVILVMKQDQFTPFNRFKFPQEQ